MSDKVRPWRQKQRSRAPTMAIRRSQTAGKSEIRAIEDVVIPESNVFVRDAIRQCNRKRAYPTEAIAAKVGASTAERTGLPIRAYPCPHCGGWHVGSYRSP